MDAVYLAREYAWRAEVARACEARDTHRLRALRAEYKQLRNKCAQEPHDRGKASCDVCHRGHNSCMLLHPGCKGDLYGSIWIAFYGAANIWSFRKCARWMPRALSTILQTPYGFGLLRRCQGIRLPLRPFEALSWVEGHWTRVLAATDPRSFARRLAREGISTVDANGELRAFTQAILVTSARSGASYLL